jgi:hypothetical protein
MIVVWSLQHKCKLPQGFWKANVTRLWTQIAFESNELSGFGLPDPQGAGEKGAKEAQWFYLMLTS